MIGALIISDFCLIVLTKGVPTWLSIIVSFIYVICNVTALILWEETKSKINILEHKYIKKGGE
jgi:hypothetical protein